MDDLEAKKQELYELLKLDEREARLQTIDAELSDPAIWQDHERAGAISQERSRIVALLDQWLDADTPEAIAKLETAALMSGPYDQGGATLSIHAGTGGTEAMDWAGMV